MYTHQPLLVRQPPDPDLFPTMLGNSWECYKVCSGSHDIYQVNKKWKRYTVHEYTALCKKKIDEAIEREREKKRYIGGKCWPLFQLCKHNWEPDVKTTHLAFHPPPRERERERSAPTGAHDARMMNRNRVQVLTPEGSCFYDLRVSFQNDSFNWSCISY